MPSEPWVDVALYNLVNDPAEGWNQGKWNAAHWNGGLANASNWQSIVCDVRGIDIQRGRQQVSVAGGVETGLLRFDLDNRDGQWSAFSNVAGKLAPVLAAGTTIRVTATDGVTTWYLFYGQIESWEQEWTASDDVLHVLASDDWRRFAQNASVAWAPGPLNEMVPNRMARLLRRANWSPRQATYLQGSSTTLIGSKATALGIETGFVTTGSISEELLATAQSDGGKCFVDANGAFVYLNRNWVQLGPIPAIGARPAQPSVPLFGDWCATPGSNELPYSDLHWAYDGTAPLGAVALANAQAPEVRDSNGVAFAPAWIQTGSSKANSSGLSVLTLGGLRYRTQAEGDALAAWYLNSFDNAYIQADRLEVYPHLDDRLWSACLGLRIGDHLEILRRERQTTLDMQVAVEGIHVTITPQPERMVSGKHYGQWLYEYATSQALKLTASARDAGISMPERAQGPIEESAYSVNVA